MVISVTIGWGLALVVAGILLWAGLALWPSKNTPGNDLFGVGALLDGVVRGAIGLSGTIVLLVLYIVLKIGLGV